MPTKNDITIRFCLNKGDHASIERSQFSDEELDDIRTCLSLNLTFNPTSESSAKIKSVQIIYDGITPLEDAPYGYRIDQNSEYPLDGYPAPIIRFLLDRAMDESAFFQCLEQTEYIVCTSLMEQNDDEPCFAEDHNGYSSIMTKQERIKTATLLKHNGSYSGKIFYFPDGFPENGYAIPAMKFALQPPVK